jgi:peptide/nickel transport system ATP-binding protein
LHPYTFKLIGAFPSVVGPKKRLQFIPGNPPNFLNLPQGCRFNPRCPFAQDICRRDLPELREIEDGHLAKCHFAGELDFSEVQ